jgi:hypothetical protein
VTTQAHHVLIAVCIGGAAIATAIGALLAHLLGRRRP